MASNSNGNGAPNRALLDEEDLQGGSQSSSKGSTATAIKEPEADPTQDADIAGLVGVRMPTADMEMMPVVGGDSGESSDSETDELEEDESVVASRRTTTPLWANPIVKLVFVAAIGGFSLAIVGFVFRSMQTAGTRDLAPVVTAPEEEESEADPFEAQLFQQEQEIGSLKTRNALGNQQQALEMQGGEGETASGLSAAEMLTLQSQLAEREKQRQAASGGAGPTATPTPTATSPTRVSSAPAPAPRSYSRSQPRPEPSRAAPTRSAPSSRGVATEPIDPMERWVALSHLGSYGSGTALAQVPPSLVPAAEPAAELAAATPTFSDPGVKSSSAFAIEEAAILGHTLMSVPAGAYASARLVTPIYWAQDLANEQQSQRSALELTEPLYAGNGEVALPAGTTLVAEVSVIAGSGLLEMSVTDVVVTRNGVQQMMQLPTQQIVIAGADGNPLIARELRDGREIRSAEMQLAALGALGNVGALLNRPTSSTTIIGTTGSATSTTNGPVNILAGLLQGAANAVLPIEQGRVQDRLEAYDDRPRIWFHDAEQPVTVFVVDEFTFRAD